jgi:hypothetical protein
MDFEQAFNEFVFNRIEQIMLSEENLELKALYEELDCNLEKLGINKNDCDDLRKTIFCLIDSLILLAYKQALADTISFFAKYQRSDAAVGGNRLT